MRRAPLAALLALSCSGAPEPAPRAFADCTEPACRRAWVEAHFEEAPDRVAAELAGLADPVEREALVLLLSEAHPGRTGQLCDLLEGPGAQRCRAIDSRPHLEADLSDLRAQAEAKGPPRLFMDHVREAALPDPWEGARLEVPRLPCPGGVVTAACATEVALEAARARRWDEAVAACRAVEAAKWRQECLFQSAEAALNPGGAGRPTASRVGPAMDLCQAAGVYRSRCFQHLSLTVAQQAPLADRASESDWTSFSGLVDAGADHLEPHDPSLARLWQDKVWAKAAWLGWSRVETLTGAPVPELALPHLRAVMAIRLVGAAPQGATLGELQAALDAALARAPAGAPGSLGPAEAPPQRATWPDLLPEEAAVPTLPYLEGGLRAHHADPGIDGLICLVEAAGQVAPPRTDLLREGLSHEVDEIRWAAVRVLEVVDPGGRVSLPSTDPSPLVQARLDAARPD